MTAAAAKAKAPTTHRRRGRKGKSVYRGVCVTREGKWRAVIYKERKQVCACVCVPLFLLSTCVFCVFASVCWSTFLALGFGGGVVLFSDARETEQDVWYSTMSQADFCWSLRDRHLKFAFYCAARQSTRRPSEVVGSRQEDMGLLPPRQFVHASCFFFLGRGRREVVVVRRSIGAILRSYPSVLPHRA